MSVVAQDVVEWGTDESPRPALTRAFRLQDRQITLGVAAVGAALLAASLVVHWQVTTLPPDNVGGGFAAARPQLKTTVAGLDAWGSGYLLGLMGLLGLAALALFGAPNARPHARIAGLGWSAGLVGLLVATALSLDNTSTVLGYSYLLNQSTESQYAFSYGPGPFLALGGVAAMAAAIYLSERQPAQAPTRAPKAAEARVAAPEPIPGPVDLTVTPAAPFVHLPPSYDGRD